MLPALHIIVGGFVRRTWFVAVVTIIACAMFAARAVSAVAASKLEPDAIAPPLRSPQASRPGPTSPPLATPSANIVVERNIFCSSCELTTTHGPGPTSPSSLGYRGEPAELIATSLGKQPVATVHVLATDVAGSWGIGERIPGVGTIARIGGASIDVLDATGARGTLSLLGAAAAAGPGAATPMPPTAAADSPYADRVAARADGSYDVDRSLVRELVSGATKPGGVRLLPIMKDNEVAGVRVLGAKAGSVAAAVGLKSGDSITEIDGQPLKNAQQLIDLLARLDSISDVTVSGKRGTKPLALTLHLR